MAKVSIITPFYNGSKIFLYTLDSVLRQTFKDFEYIIVDDGSSPEEAAYLDTLSSTYDFLNISVIHIPNGGVSNARNVGISKSTAEYIAILDSDDLWDPTYLEKTIALLDSKSNVGLAYTHTTFVNDTNTKVLGYLTPSYQGNVQKELLVHGNFAASGSNAVMRRSVLDILDYCFDADMAYCEEWELFTRLSAITDFGLVPEPLAMYRLRYTSASAIIDKFESETFTLINNAVANLNVSPSEKESIKQQALSTGWLSTIQISLSRVNTRKQMGILSLAFRKAAKYNPKVLRDKSFYKLIFKSIVFFVLSPKLSRQLKRGTHE